MREVIDVWGGGERRVGSGPIGSAGDAELGELGSRRGKGPVSRGLGPDRDTAGAGPRLVPVLRGAGGSGFSRWLPTQDLDWWKRPAAPTAAG